MAKKKRARKDPNAGLNPVQIFKRRLLIETALVWLAIFYVSLIATIVAIQVGPFGLNLAGEASNTYTSFEIALISGQILGGFCLLWFFLAIPFAVLYYRAMNKRRCPKTKDAVATASEPQTAEPLLTQA